VILLFAGCSEEKFETERFYSMGTFVSLTLPKKDFHLAADARAKMAELENYVTSETDIANESEDFCFENDMDMLYEYGMSLGDMTDDRFSIYAETITKEYGFQQGPFRVPSDIRLQQLADNIVKMYDISMDLGAYAKGWIVDKTAESLKSKNVTSAMINAGGDLYALGSKDNHPWRVAIRHPKGSDSFISIVNLTDKAIATSGDYERFFTLNGIRYHHIIDATTARNPEYYHSVSVIADTVMEADGLATAFFLLPSDEVEKKCRELKTPVLLYTADAKIEKLCGWEKFETD
jgi:thiamine biosynthesis lipoprotein